MNMGIICLYPLNIIAINQMVHKHWGYTFQYLSRQWFQVVHLSDVVDKELKFVQPLRHSHLKRIHHTNVSLQKWGNRLANSKQRLHIKIYNIRNLKNESLIQICNSVF